MPAGARRSGAPSATATGIWPSTNAAKRPFGGSFDEAVRAAGLAPHRPGPRRAPLEARPDVAQRAPLAPRGVAGELADAGRRAALAEARATVLERRLEKARNGSEEARRRAKRAGDQAARARRSRDRVRQEAEDRREAAVEAAAARDRGRRLAGARGEDQGRAAARDAAAERARAVAAERRLAELEGSGPRRGPGPAQIARLREGGPWARRSSGTRCAGWRRRARRATGRASPAPWATSPRRRSAGATRSDGP